MESQNRRLTRIIKNLKKFRYTFRKSKKMEYFIFDPESNNLVSDEQGKYKKYPIHEAIRLATSKSITSPLFLVDKEQVDELKQQIQNYKTDNYDNSTERS